MGRRDTPLPKKAVVWGWVVAILFHIAWLIVLWKGVLEDL